MDGKRPTSGGGGKGPPIPPAPVSPETKKVKEEPGEEGVLAMGRASKLAAVSPYRAAKPKEEKVDGQEGAADGVTADTVMGFKHHPNATNRELVTKHDYVRKARRLHSKLGKFLEWADSTEGRELQRRAETDKQGAKRALATSGPAPGTPPKRAKTSPTWTPQPSLEAAVTAVYVQHTGKMVFQFGRHRGETFEQVARDDPRYHERYQYKLRQSGKSPEGELAAYIEWFNRSGRVAPPHTPDDYRRGSISSPRSAGDTWGETRFAMGCHRGQTYREVARTDPKYHLRCRKTGQTLNGSLGNYVRYFEQHGHRWVNASWYPEEDDGREYLTHP